MYSAVILSRMRPIALSKSHVTERAAELLHNGLLNGQTRVPCQEVGPPES